MKNKSFYLLLKFAAVAWLAPNFLMAQGTHTTVVIGTGTSSSSYPAFLPYNNHSTTEMIYTAAEIGTAGMIDTLWFYSDATASLACTSLRIYMGTTASSTFASSSDWYGVDDVDLVYDAATTIGGAVGWFAVALQTPYYYPGNDNLVVVVTKTAANYNLSSKWRYTSTSSVGYRTLYRGSDGSSSHGDLSTLTATTSGTRTYDRPNVKFSINTVIPDCFRPINLAAELTYTGASISWTGCDDAFGYEICYGTTDQLSSYIASAETVYDTVYDLEGLEGDTTYYVWVRSLCSDDSSTWSRLVFTIPVCGEYAGGTATSSYVPFHGNYDYGYTQSIYPATALEGAGIISGISFRTSSVPSNYTTRTVSVSMGTTTRTSLSTTNYIDESTLTQVAANVPMDVSTAGWVYIPFTTPFVYDGTSNVVVSVTNHTGHYSSFSYYHHTPSVGNAVYWYRDNTPITGTSPAGTSGTTTTVPDVRFDADCGADAGDCSRPFALSVDDFTYNSIEVSWIGCPDADSYEVRYATVPDVNVSSAVTEISTDVMYAISGLRGNTAYYIWVRSVCGDGTSVWSTPVSVTTLPSCATLLNVQVADTSHSMALLTWDVNTSEGQPLSYVVVAWQAAGESTWSTDVVQGTLSYVLDGLRSGAVYEVTLTSVCGLDSSDAATLTFTTPACYEYGGGTATNSYVPFHGNYDYGYTQTIYPAGGLSGADTIRGISFRTSSVPSNYTTRTVSVSMGTTTRTSLSTTNYINESTLTQVAANVPMDVSTAGWVYIPFTTPFVYDGTSNVVVSVTNHTGHYSSFSYYHHTPSVGNAVYWYRDNTPITGTSPAGTSGTTTTVPDIRFEARCPSSECSAPMMTVSSVGSDRIQLRWTPTGDESAWIVGYKADGDVDWTEFNTTSTTYTFTGLNASTHYLLRVGTECDGDTLFANGDATTLAGNPGDPSCPVPSDLIATADTDRVTLSWTPQGDENLWQVRLYNSDFDSLYICSASSGVLIDDLDVDAGYDVTVRAVCGDGDTSDWSAAVFFTTGMADPGCVAPTGITVAAVTDSSVVASWTPESGERRWQVHIYNAGFDSVYRAYSSYVAMGGLSPRSSYNIAVRAVCGEGDTSDWSAVVSFSTRNVGVDNPVDGVSVLVRPNPAIHAAQVDISGVNGTVMLSVVDPGGRVVHTDRMECADTCVKTFYVDGLSRGAWFIRIASDTFAVVRKLIVQ